jgi:AcrR family transcriptional regulator
MNNQYHSGVSTSMSATSDLEDPRVCRTRSLVIAAAQGLFDERGWDGVNHSSVSQASGIGRTTLYRHWPNKAALLQDVIAERMRSEFKPLTGDLREDLLAQLRQFRQAVEDPKKRGAMAAILAEAEHHDSFARMRRILTETATTPLVTAVRSGISEGALPADLDLDLAVLTLCGPIFYNGLMLRRRTTDAMLATIVDDFLHS